MKKTLLLLLVSFGSYAQNFKPEVTVSYGAGMEIIGTDILGLTNEFYALTHSGSENEFLASIQNPIFNGPSIEAGLSYKNRIFVRLVFGQNTGVYSGVVDGSGSTQDYRYKHQYSRNTNHTEYGLSIGYRFDTDKRASFYVATGLRYINRIDNLSFEKTETRDTVVTVFNLMGDIHQTAWAIPLEFGQEWKIIKGLSAGWYLRYMWISNRFEEAKVSEYTINNEDSRNDLTEREKNWQFNGESDIPSDENSPRNLDVRRENLSRIGAGLQLTYRF